MNQACNNGSGPTWSRPGWRWTFLPLNGRTVDYVSDKQHPLVKQARDAASAAWRVTPLG